MSAEDNLQYVLAFFSRDRERLHKIVATLVDDSAQVLVEAESIYAGLSESCAYLDEPHNPLATALFYCNVNLALFLALRPRGVDAHQFGCAVLTDLATAELPPAAPPPGSSVFDKPGPGNHPGEFQVQPVQMDDPATQWGYNIKSCAICHQYSQHDAMELVPYMCASDDVISDIRGEGLRRTGTIALGAAQCDFRYSIGATPRRAAQISPDRIRFVHE